MDEGSQQSDSLYEKWSRKTRVRTHSLLVGSRIFYVNAYHLADISTFFEKLFFNDFKEANDKSANLPEEDPENVLEFLAVVCDAKDMPRKRVNDWNCAIMIRYADIWEVGSLKERCEDFLIRVFPLLQPSLECCASILVAASNHHIEPAALENVISRLAFFGSAALIDSNICDMISNSRIVAALFLAAATRPSNEVKTDSAELHNFSKPVDKLRECSFYRCWSKEEVRVCSRCSLPLCSDHRSAVPCFATYCLHCSRTDCDNGSYCGSRRTPVPNPSQRPQVKVAPYKSGFTAVNSSLLSVFRKQEEQQPPPEQPGT